jgi:hypothetical protein
MGHMIKQPTPPDGRQARLRRLTTGSSCFPLRSLQAQMLEK